MADPIKPVRKVALHRFTSGEYKRALWVIDAEPGTTVEDCLNPAYYVHVCQNLRKRHEIVIWGAQDEFRLKVVVRACGEGWARVAILEKHEFEVAEEKELAIPESDKYEVKFRGAAGWSVLRKEDRHVMKEGLSSKRDAIRFLSDLLEREAVH